MCALFAVMPRFWRAPVLDAEIRDPCGDDGGADGDGGAFFPGSSPPLSRDKNIRIRNM